MGAKCRLRASQVFTGPQYACALLRDTTVSCWGYNNEGELGNGSTAVSSTPGLVPGLTGVVQVTVGAGTACARLADSRVLCWGGNAGGTVGDGTKSVRLVPTPVSWP